MQTRSRYSASIMQEIKEKALLYNSFSVVEAPLSPCRRRPVRSFLSSVTRKKQQLSSNNVQLSSKKEKEVDTTAKSDKNAVFNIKEQRSISLQSNRIKDNPEKDLPDKLRKQSITPAKLEFMQARRSPYYIVESFGQTVTMNARPGISVLLESFSELIENAKSSNHEAMVDLTVKLINQAVDLHDLELVVVLVQFCGDLLFGNSKFKQALYFYNQVRVCSGFIGSPSKKVDALISMSKCAVKMLRNDLAIKFLLKGLEYCYLSNDLQRELFIYDLMCLYFYYSGELRQARYYHQRFIGAVYEQKGEQSRARISAREYLVNYTRHIPIMCHEVSSLFLAYLSLPLNLDNAPSKVRQQAIHRPFELCTSTIEQVDHDPEFVDVIDLPKEPAFEFDFENESRIDPPLKLVIDSILIRTARLKPIRTRGQSKHGNDGKDWLQRIFDRLRSNLRSSQSLRGRALLTHDANSNMLLKRQGWEYYYGFVFKGMLISYCQFVTGRQNLIARIQL